MSTFEVLTVYLVDAAAGHDKLYRTYAGDDGLVVQYGPNGTRGWGNLSYRPDADARRNARLMIEKKEKGGYNSRQTHTFDWNQPVDTRPGMEMLVDRYEGLKANRSFAGPRSAPAPGAPIADVPGAEPEAPDRFAEFTARALAAISLSVTDRDRAAVELSLLNARWEELEQIHGKAKSYMNTLHQMMSGSSA